MATGVSLKDHGEYLAHAASLTTSQTALAQAYRALRDSGVLRERFAALSHEQRLQAAYGATPAGELAMFDAWSAGQGHPAWRAWRAARGLTDV